MSKYQGRLSTNSYPPLEIEQNDVIEFHRDKLDAPLIEILEATQSSVFLVVAMGDEIELKPTSASTVAPYPTSESMFVQPQDINLRTATRLGKWSPYRVDAPAILDRTE